MIYSRDNHGPEAQDQGQMGKYVLKHHKVSYGQYYQSHDICEFFVYAIFCFNLFLRIHNLCWNLNVNFTQTEISEYCLTYMINLMIWQISELENK